MTVDIADAQANTPRNFFRSFMKGIRRDWLIYVTFVVLVMSLAAILVAISGLARTSEQNQQLKKLADCQTTYNEINNERTRQLTESSKEERVAERAADDALFAVADDLAGGKSEAEVARDIALLQQRLKVQREARAKYDLDRAQHPVPPPPRALCGSY